MILGLRLIMDILMSRYVKFRKENVVSTTYNVLSLSIYEVENDVKSRICFYLWFIHLNIIFLT